MAKTLPELKDGTAVQDADLFISRQGADTEDSKISALDLKNYVAAGAGGGDSIQKTFTAFEAILQGRVIAIRTDGDVELADKDDPDHQCDRIIGVAGNTANIGDPVTVTLDGVLSGVNLGSLAIGLFLGNNGILVSTPPVTGILQRIGEQISATEFNVKLAMQIIR